MTEKTARLILVGQTSEPHDRLDDCPKHRQEGQDDRNLGRRVAQNERRVEERLIALCTGAIDSRRMAAGYVESAGQCLARARAEAGDDADAPRQDSLDEARRASRQARKCLLFARLCERRASSLATQLEGEHGHG